MVNLPGSVYAPPSVAASAKCGVQKLTLSRPFLLFLPSYTRVWKNPRMSNSSAAFRVFQGCKTLLAPARSSTTAATAAPVKSAKLPSATASKAKSKPKEKSAAPKDVLSRPSGIQKVIPVSPALADFLKSPQSSRVDAVKQIWSYIKLNNLQNPSNKREIFCDDKLKSIFDGKEKVGFLEIGKLLSRHFVKTA